jgi:hypothetical protein
MLQIQKFVFFFGIKKIDLCIALKSKRASKYKKGRLIDMFMGLWLNNWL